MHGSGGSVQPGSGDECLRRSGWRWVYQSGRALNQTHPNPKDESQVELFKVWRRVLLGAVSTKTVHDDFCEPVLYPVLWLLVLWSSILPADASRPNVLLIGWMICDRHWAVMAIFGKDPTWIVSPLVAVSFKRPTAIKLSVGLLGLDDDRLFA